MYSIKSLFSDDVIEFRQTVLDKDIDEYEHPLLNEDITCSNCSKKQSFYSATLTGWWIDELSADCRDFKELADLCLECRNETQIKHSEGSVQCHRCKRYGEYGEGKWNLGPEELGRLIVCFAWFHGTTFCYDCHWRIHYNK